MSVRHCVICGISDQGSMPIERYRLIQTERDPGGRRRPDGRGVVTTTRGGGGSVDICAECHYRYVGRTLVERQSIGSKAGRVARANDKVRPVSEGPRVRRFA